MSHHADSPSDFLDLENTVERERQPHGPVASAPPPLPAELNTCFAVSGRTASLPASSPRSRFSSPLARLPRKQSLRRKLARSIFSGSATPGKQDSGEGAVASAAMRRKTQGQAVMTQPAAFGG